MPDTDVVLGNPNGPQMRVDVDDKRLAVVSLDFAHEKIHDSESFTATFSNAVTNINEQTALAWICGTAKEMHVVFTVQASKNTTCYLYRDTAIVAGAGGTLTPSSRNQVTLGTPTCKTVAATPLAGAMSSYNEAQAAAGSIGTATQLDKYVLAGGEGPRSFGVQASRDAQEWVFGGGVQFAFVMNAETADDDIHYMRMDWYEK